MVQNLRTRASIRRNATGRLSVEKGKSDRLSDQLDSAADIIEQLVDMIEGENLKLVR